MKNTSPSAPLSLKNSGESPQQDTPDQRELPPGWCWAGLEDFTELLDSKRIPVNSEERARRVGPYPYYGANGQAGTIDGYLFDGDFVLLAEDGGNFDNPSKGVAYKVSGKFWVNNHAHILSPKNGMPISFLEHLLNSFDWLPYVTGTTRYKLTQGGMQKAKFALPPLPEQRRIVAKLDDLLARSRKAREALEAIPPLLEKLRQSILAAAFRGDLTAAWREKNPDVEPASVLLQRIRAERRKKWEEAELAKLMAKGKTPLGDSWKDKYQEPEPVNTEGLPELPEGWCWATTAELASPEEYSLAIGPFGSDLKVEDYKDQGVPLVFVRHIKAQNFEGMNPKYVSEEKAFDLRAHIVSPGDVLVTKMGDPPGDVAIYPESRPPAVITADCLKWRLNKSAGTPRYFEQALNFPFCQEQLLGITQGVAQRKISLERFRTLFVPVPPIREQEELCALLAKAFHNTQSIKTSLKSFSDGEQSLSASILAKAFRGELVPQDPADEPAEVMLERLRKEQEQAPVASKRGRKPKEGGTPAGKKAKGGQGTLF